MNYQKILGNNKIIQFIDFYMDFHIAHFFPWCFLGEFSFWLIGKNKGSGVTNLFSLSRYSTKYIGFSFPSIFESLDTKKQLEI